MDKTFYTEENPIRFPYAAKYKPDETKLVVYYDIQDISAPTTICTNYDSSIKSIEVDGVLLDDVVTTYQFDSVGEHIIKYEFNDPTTVGKNAPLFYNITTIKRVVIPNTFTAIGGNAFNCCSGITSLTIGNNVASIGNSAFTNCNSLTYVNISNLETWCNITFDSVYSNPLYYAHRFYLNGTEVTDLVIPDGVTSISPFAFQNCSGLTSVTFPNSVTSIGIQAFCECSGLTSLTIGSGMVSIDKFVLSNCTNLAAITSLATTAPTITYDTFSNVKNGGTLYVPQGSTGYDVWVEFNYLGKYGWTKVEQ